MFTVFGKYTTKGNFYSSVGRFPGKSAPLLKMELNAIHIMHLLVMTNGARCHRWPSTGDWRSSKGSCADLWHILSMVLLIFRLMKIIFKGFFFGGGAGGQKPHFNVVTILQLWNAGKPEIWSATAKISSHSHTEMWRPGKTPPFPPQAVPLQYFQWKNWNWGNTRRNSSNFFPLECIKCF